jgi:2-desacetyl-2-hydroxyethyl bacteriochlorophyllide A dehydrogenase
MKRQALYFTAPEKVEIREEEIPDPGAGQLLVKTQVSAISAGTEMLVYRGLVPEDMALDATISALGGAFRYPLQYGYSSAGTVIAAGAEVDPAWVGRPVFAFQPHQTHFLASPADLMPLPRGTGLESAVFLPNMETALNVVMDGRPMVGETAAVFGLGIVGLLVTGLLAKHPLGALAAWDRYPNRREEAEKLGADLALDTADTQPARDLLQERGSPDGFDLLFELSGAPAALDQALALAGYASRVVIGSWYGRKPVQLDLGGRFHRSRIRLIASQVSTLAPDLTGRWTKARRFAVAWEALNAIRPTRWITQRIPFAQAASAYDLISTHPEQTIQVVLAYE